MTITTINPATGESIQIYQSMLPAEIKAIIELTHQAFLQWRNTDFSIRKKKMQKLAALLLQNKEHYAKLMTTEMGKPIISARAEIEKCAWVCNYYAEQAEEALQPRIIQTENHKSYVSYQPLGIVFAIMPWNFPFWQVFRFAAPNTMAGNASILKHAAISTGTGLAIEELFLQAGFPDNLFRTLIISNEAAEVVISDPHVTAVTLTGSDRAGQSVGALAGKYLKKVVLELGGSDPYIILEDADLENAAEACVKSRLNNAGQVCIAAKRIIAVEPIYDRFLKIIQEKMKLYPVGDPNLETTKLGPMARADLRDTVHRQVTESVNKGAQLLMGGQIPQGQGFYYPATLLTNVQAGMPAIDEEIFGPVVTVICAKDEADAIYIANDTIYGLGAAVFSQNIARAEIIAREKIQAGSCAVNTFVASDPRLPFGGIKESGYGRELSDEGIRSFMNVKTVVVR